MRNKLFNQIIFSILRTWKQSINFISALAVYDVYNTDA